MLVSKVEHIKIAGIAAAVSNSHVALEELGVEDNPKVVEKFIKTTGVRGRYNAGLRQTTSDFCYAAAKELLAAKHIDPKEIGVLVFVTQSPDYQVPATACLLQQRLGLSTDCLAFDVNLGCSGFSCGINIIASLLNSSNSKKALLLAGDTSAKSSANPEAENVSHFSGMLFGDSGTATLLEKDEAARPISMISRTDGSGYKAIIAPFGAFRHPLAPFDMMGTQVDDMAVFNFATFEAPILLKETMSLCGTTPQDYDCLVLHQANLILMKQVAKRSGFTPEQMLVSLDEFANTSSASIPNSLVKQYGPETEDRELHALMCGFGIGLSWSTVDAYVRTGDILPLIHTDEYFDDGYGEELQQRLGTDTPNISDLKKELRK